MKLTEMKNEVLENCGPVFYGLVNDVNAKMVKSGVVEFDPLTLISVIMSVVNLLKDCNFQLPKRLNFSQKFRLTRVISRAMIGHNDEDAEQKIFDAIVKQHKSMVQEDLDQLVVELKKTGKLVD